MTQFNRLGSHPEPEPLKYILAHPEMHDRLVNGSDYPLPAINIVIRTKALMQNGFISTEEKRESSMKSINSILFSLILS